MRFATFALAATLTSAGLFAAEPVGHAISVDFTSKGDTYICRTEIMDLSNNTIIAKPTITAKKGESGILKVGHDTEFITMTFLLDQASTTGTYSITFNKNGKPINTYKGSIAVH